jgi:hypothetical protein
VAQPLQEITDLAREKAMRRIVYSSLILLALMLISCGPSLGGTRQDTPAPESLTLVFKYGVGAKNVLDTARGTFTKDMIVDPSITVDLRLTREDLDRIAARMDETDFWSYPEVLEYEIPADGMIRAVTPYSSYYFRAQRAATVKELTWEDEHADQSGRATRLRELTVLIREIIESRPEYKALPEPRGGYM